MDFKCDELILGKKDADSRALTSKRTGIASWGALWEGWEALQSQG